MLTENHNFAKLLIVVSAMLVHTTSSASDLEAWCEKQWIQESSKLLSGNATDQTALLKKWLSYEPRCGVTYTYAGRLALVQIYMNDFAAAKSTLEKSPKGKSSFGYSVDAARIQVDIAERLSNQKPVTSQELVRFEAAYSDLVKRYPNWPTGFALLGGIQTLLGKHSDAVRNLDAAKVSEAYDLSGVYRNLTISLAAIGEYRRAIEAADRAFALNKGLTSDPSFAYELANTNSALGQFDDAETVLKVILAKRPEVRNDPEFVKAVDFYKQARTRAK